MTQHFYGRALSEAILLKLWKRCNFHIPDDDMIFFGLRGLLPVNQSGTGFSEEHKVSIVNVDHRHMRCTIGQWKPGRGIALFPGSTVPSNNHSNPYISRAKRRGGFGTNQLMLGRYAHRKGQHGIGRRTGHKAFRQEGFFPVWRTKDDLDYDLDDFVDMNIQGRAPRPIVWDNIHCGWSNGPSSADFTSAGCQVVAGFPRCEKRGNAPNTGPWKKFYDNAYGISQKKFFYGLFDGLETQRIAELNGEDLYQNLRFNSEGELVKIMQTRLNSKGFNVGTPDGEFGPDTLEGLMAFQAQEIGESSDDGILGPMTADALGMKLPKLALFIHRKLWKIGLTDSAVQGRPGLRRSNSKMLGYALGGWSSRAQAAPGRVLYGGEAERRAAINSSIAACGR